MPTRSSVDFVPEEALFDAEANVTVSGIDIDRESPLIIDRCLNDVRARILRSQERKGSSSSSSSPSSSSHPETMASHLDDVAACRDRVWQHIYHPKHKQNIPAIINVDLSSGSVVGVSDSSSPVFASVHDQSGSNPPKSAYEALKRMEEAQKKALEADAKVKLDDVARRSSGTSTRGEGEGAGGDLISRVVGHQVVRMVTVDNKEKNDGTTTSEENFNENNTKKNDNDSTNKATTNTFLNERKAALAARIQQSQKDTLLALYDAVRPDPLVGATPLPVDHFWNHPYVSKRSTNMLLLKYLGLMYPGGKNELRRELPFSINKKTREITSTNRRSAAASSAPSSSARPAVTSLSARGRLMQQDSDSLGKLVDKQLSEGRSLMLYEDRRRRAFLSAIATQLGGGMFSSATAADFITCSSRGSLANKVCSVESKVLLRIGAGTDLSDSASTKGIHEQSRQQKIQTLQALYYLSGHNSASFTEAVLAATRPTRPLTAQMLEYALSCFKTSPFSVSHYPIKLFGFVQPTSIGGHSNFPMTRFNIFELEHLPTPTDKLRANARRIKALRASERRRFEEAKKGHNNKKNNKQADDKNSTVSANSGNDTEQLLLKKWSVQGTVFPAVGSYHVKALWSANAKLSLPEACKALGIFDRQPTANDTSSTTSSDGVDQQQAEDSDTEELGIFSSEEEAKAKAFRSRYRRKTAQRERGLVGLSFNSDRLRVISLVHSFGPAEEKGATTAGGNVENCETKADAAVTEGASPEEISRKDAAGLIAEAEKLQKPDEVPETNAASLPAADAAATASPHARRRPKAPPEETVSRPMRVADREVVGSYQDSEATLTWRRLWNPRWSLEGYARHVESIPTAREQDRAVLAAMNLNDDALLIDFFDSNSAAFSIPPPLVGPTATIFGLRLRYDNSGRLFPRGVGSFFDGFFAPLFISGTNVSLADEKEEGRGSPRSGSSKLSAPRGWVASTCAMSAFLDPIQRHVQLKGQMDLRKLTPLPWWRGKSSTPKTPTTNEKNEGEEEKVIYIIDDGSSVCADSAPSSSRSSSCSTSSFSFVPRLYERARDLFSFDLRVRVAAEAKNKHGGGDAMAFITEGDSRQYSPLVSAASGNDNKNNNNNSSASAADNSASTAPATIPASVRNLRRYVRSVKLPSQSTVQTVRGVHGNYDHVGLGGGGGSVASSVTSASYPEAYSTERLAGNWFVTSTVEMSKPISFISFGGGNTKNKDTPIPPPLRFLVFWNGLWSENSANNKESVGYAVRREPHASRRELKGWYNEYLPSSLECSWSSVWSRSKQSFTNDPAPADLPAGSTFFKFMKCGAIWDL